MKKTGIGFTYMDRRERAKEFGARLRKWRLAVEPRLTQAEAAAAAGVKSREVWSRWESGRCLPHRGRLKAVVEAVEGDYDLARVIVGEHIAKYQRNTHHKDLSAKFGVPVEARKGKPKKKPKSEEAGEGARKGSQQGKTRKPTASVTVTELDNLEIEYLPFTDKEEFEYGIIRKIMTRKFAEITDSELDLVRLEPYKFADPDLFASLTQEQQLVISEFWDAHYHPFPHDLLLEVLEYLVLTWEFNYYQVENFLGGLKRSKSKRLKTTGHHPSYK